MADPHADLHLDVWQFVRLMVQMEETLKRAGFEPRSGKGGGGALKSLYDLWEDLWVDLDAQLVDLGRRDPEAFADLMMDQEVVLENPPAGARGLVADELSKVVDALKRQLARTEDPAQVEDLSFERDELIATIHELRPGKGGPARHGPERQGPERQGPERQGPTKSGPNKAGPRKQAAKKGPAKKPAGRRQRK